MERRLSSAEEMFDILSTMNAGKFATICYVNASNVLKTRRNMNIDALSQSLNDYKGEPNDFWYNPLMNFSKDDSVKKNPVSQIISITRYTLNWSTEESYKKNFKDFSANKDKIDKEYGIYKDPSERRKGGFSKVNSMGVSLGNTDNTRNTAYTHQNTYGARIKTIYYVVDENGNITSEIPSRVVKSMINASKTPGETALEKLNKSNEEIKEYIDKINNLNFKPREFIVDKILYIVATINGDKLFFINENLVSEIKKIKINRESLVKKANELFNNNYKEISEVCIKIKNKIMENKIRIAVRDSIKKLLF